MNRTSLDKIRRRDAFGRAPKGSNPAMAFRRSPSHLRSHVQKVKEVLLSPPHINIEALDSENKSNVLQLPSKTCTRDTVPTQVTFALNKVSSLLQYVTPGSIVAFDIDDTLIKKRHYACSLLSNEGMRQFHVYMQSHLRDYTFAEKQSMVSSLYAACRDVELAESDTASVVRTLQERGVQVFGLTARSPNLVGPTMNTLREVGVDLSVTAPDSLKQAVEMQTGAVAVNGIVFCGDTDKGVVLQRLLALGWLTWAPSLGSASSSSTNTPECIHGIPGGFHNGRPCELHEHSEDGKKCPERTIWFIDDSLPMIVGMMQAWNQMTEQYKELRTSLGAWASQLPCRGKMNLVCCHYSHPAAVAAALANASSRDNATSGTATPDMNAIIRAQIEEFVATGSFLTDAHATTIITTAASTSISTASTSSSAAVIVHADGTSTTVTSSSSSSSSTNEGVIVSSMGDLDQ